MFQIMVKLIAIFGMAKDLHYAATGAPFYSDHLLYDEVAAGLLDFSDAIAEDFYMAQAEAVPKMADVFAAAASQTPAEVTPAALQAAIRTAIYEIDEYRSARAAALSAGDDTLLGDISKALAKKLAFMNRRLQGGEGL